MREFGTIAVIRRLASQCTTRSSRPWMSIVGTVQLDIDFSAWSDNDSGGPERRISSQFSLCTEYLRAVADRCAASSSLPMAGSKHITWTSRFICSGDGSS